MIGGWLPSLTFGVGHNPEQHCMRHSKVERKAVRDSKNVWQLDGESDLRAEIIPSPPLANQPTTIRLTLGNSLGPIDDAECFVRLGDPKKPTEMEDLDSAGDWMKAELVEELVCVANKEMLRAEAKQPFHEEVPWDATYEAKIAVPRGRHSIEIKVVSHVPELLTSMVLTGWTVKTK